MTTEKFTDFVQLAGEVFEFEDFEDLEVETDDIIPDELGYASADIVRDETNEVFRFCIFNRDLNLAADLPLLFELYRDLENEDEEDEFEGAVLLARGSADEDFWYVFRTESEEIGLFHSDFSYDDAADEDEDDEADTDDDDAEIENVENRADSGAQNNIRPS